MVFNNPYQRVTKNLIEILEVVMISKFTKSFPVLPLSLMVGISACGGSSSAPKTEPSPPVSSTPVTTLPSAPEVLTEMVTIDENTAGLIVPYSVSVPESMLQLADLVVSELELSGQSELTSQSFISCKNGGGTSVDFRDNNADGHFNQGDEIMLAFQNCESASLQSNLNGGATITLDTMTATASTLEVDWNITSVDLERNTVGIQGTTEMHYAFADASESLSVNVDSNGLMLTIDDAYEIYKSLSVTKSMNSQFNYSIAFDFEISSQLLGGVLTCQSDTPMSGVINALPYEMSVACNGAGNGAVTTYMSFDSPDTYDPYNDTKISATTSPGAVLEADGFLAAILFEGTVSKPILAFQYARPDIQSLQTMNVDLDNKIFQNIIASPLNDKLYIHGNTVDTNQIFVSEIDVQTMKSTRTAYYDFEDANLTNFEISTNSGDMLVIVSQNTKNLTKLYAIDPVTLDMREFADFTGVIRQDVAAEYNFISSLQQAKNGDVYFIVEDQSNFSSTQKLVRLSEGGTADVLELQDSHYRAFLYINDSDRLYVSDIRGVSLYDISGGTFDLLETNRFNYDTGAVIKPIVIDFEKDGVFYTNSNYIADWDSEKFEYNGFAGDKVHYFPELDAAIGIRNMDINTYSISQNRQLSLVHNNNLTELPYFDIEHHVFVDDYLVIMQRLPRTGTEPQEYELIKIPFNWLF